MRYFSCENAYPIKYIASGHLISKNDFIHDKRNLEENVLIMVEEGILHISVNGKKKCVEPNQYILLKGDEFHEGYLSSTGKLTYNWVHFIIKGEFKQISSEKVKNEYKLSLKDHSNRGKLIIPELSEVEMQQKGKVLFNQLLDLSRQDKLFSSEIIDYALSLLLMELTQEAFDKHNQLINNIQPGVARIMDWVKANYYESLTVKKIAFEFGYNPDYLSSLFKQSTKMTLIQYVNKTRIDISKSLLINYDISIKEIAYSCGFYDQKYYMKVFKGIEKLTPTQYRHAFTKRNINRQK